MNERLLVAELSELIREGRARVIGLIRQELLSGVKTTEQYEKLRVHLRSFPDEAVDPPDYEEAAKFGNRCWTKGVAISIVDILYALLRSRGGGRSLQLTLISPATEGFFPSGFILLGNDNSVSQKRMPGSRGTSATRRFSKIVIAGAP